MATVTDTETTAKHKTKCPVCFGEIQKGEPIRLWRTMAKGRKRWAHAGCFNAPPEGVDGEPQTAELSADAEERINKLYSLIEQLEAKVEANGPLWGFPSPYGLTGYVSQDGLAAPRELSTINNGIPSPAGIGKLEIPIDLINELTFQGTLTFFAAAALTAIVNLYVVLRAYIQTPVR